MNIFILMQRQVLCSYKENPIPLFDKAELYEYSYDTLLKFYGDKATTNRIGEEIQFCKQMHQLRPQQRELEEAKQIVLKINNY